MPHDQLLDSSKSVSGWSPHVCIHFTTDSRVCSSLPPVLPAVNARDILQEWVTDWPAKTEVYAAVEEITYHDSVGTAVL